MRLSLDALFKPSSVAVIGASANPSKMGHVVLKNLSDGRFRLHPVNPKEKEILGLPCRASVADVPGTVDMAVISLPAAATVDAMAECVDKGVGVVIIASSGFRESGDEGRELEARLLALVKGKKTRLLGPNTMGVFVPSRGLDTFFIPKDRSRRPNDGTVAMLSQSGAVSVAFLERAEASGLGISACVGLGNKSDINENEVVEYLAADRKTKCIALYLESFSDGRRFLEIARAITAKKPLVVLKAGRTKAGSAAAQSHTGAIASSSDSLVDGALKQAGVVRVYDEEELIDTARVLVHLDHIGGDRICVVASAGGFGVIAADYVESRDHGAALKMAKLTAASERTLGKVMPKFGSVSNPVDLTASVTDEMYDSVLKVLQKDPGVDGIMMSLELQPPNVTRKLIDAVARRSKSKGAPIVVSAFGGDLTAQTLLELESRGVPAYPTIWRSVRALRTLAERGYYLEARE